MADDVKPRSYRSERRREQAELTRTRMLDAAAELFEQRGFARASVSAVAARAGVAPETVYAHFRNKRTLLGELVRRAVRGPDERPVPEQDAPRAIAAATDQREQLRLFAADISERLERAAPLVAVVAAAAPAEPELADLFERLHADRSRNLRVLVEALARNGPLRVAEDDALETVFALTSPELHQLLRRVRGWSKERHRAWLGDALAGLLLPSPG